MAVWTKNNRACTTTWTTLRVLHQIIDKFDNAGEVTMKELAFYNLSPDIEFRKVQASALAFQIDNVFRMIRRAVYESGTTQEKAVNEIISTLLDEKKTVAHLALVSDRNYVFWGEEDDW